MRALELRQQSVFRFGRFYRQRKIIPVPTGQDNGAETSRSERVKRLRKIPSSLPGIEWRALQLVVYLINP